MTPPPTPPKRWLVLQSGLYTLLLLAMLVLLVKIIDWLPQNDFIGLLLLVGGGLLWRIMYAVLKD